MIACFGKVLLSLILCCCAALSATAQPTYIWDYDLFAKMKKDTAYFPNLRKRILTTAETVAQEKPISLSEKKRSVSGNVHNYESLATYYWKNTSNPSGSYIVKDGQVNPEVNDYDFPKLQKLANNLKYLSLAYFLTEETAYFDAYVQQIETWFLNRSTRMLPNMEYAQFAPGKNNGKGMPGGYIEARCLHDVMESLRLMNSVHDIGSSRNQKMRNWMQDFLNWSLTSETGKSVRQFANNQAVNYDFVCYDLYLYLNDRAARQAIWDQFFSKRVASQIEADGCQPTELKRTRPFSYSVFNIRIMVNFCLMAKRDGMNVTLTQQRLQAAILFLANYIGKESLFPYKDLTTDFRPLERELRQTVVRMKTMNPSNKAFNSIDLTDIYDFGI